MRLAIAGGTGWVGRLVVEAARAAGHTPVVLARSTGIDLSTGVGLAAALDGVDATVDVTNVKTTNRAKSLAFFTTTTTHLLQAANQAGVRHHVALSIVGCDRVGFAYYAAKLRQEELVLAGPIPATVLRATQFHEFAAQLLGNAVGPLVAVPRMLSRPIAAREVATALVEAAVAAPQGLAPELAGPREELMVTMTRRFVRAFGLRKLVVPVGLPGAVGKAMAHGGLLPAAAGPRGSETFDQWLASPAARRAVPGHG